MKYVVSTRALEHVVSLANKLKSLSHNQEAEPITLEQLGIPFGVDYYVMSGVTYTGLKETLYSFIKKDSEWTPFIDDYIQRLMKDMVSIKVHDKEEETTWHQ